MSLTSLFSIPDVRALIVSIFVVVALQLFTYRTAKWVRENFQDKHWIFLIVTILFLAMPFLTINHLETWLHLYRDIHVLNFPKMQILIGYEAMILCILWIIIELDLKNKALKHSNS